jgi:hypothetical protein
MRSRRVWEGLAILLLLAAGAHAQLDWGIDRQLFAGTVGQYGIAADRTRGPDTAFVGFIASNPAGDSIRVLRTTDQGETWEQFWSSGEPNHVYSNLVLRVCGREPGWAIALWLDRDATNNGDITGVRISVDGGDSSLFHPVTPSRDTIDWLALTRSFDSLPLVYAFWQDEVGRAGSSRAPMIRMARSTDLGESWTAPLDVLTGFETPATDHGAPDHLYLAARGVRSEDIAAAFSTDQGQSWTTTMLTSDSLDNNDMFPCVAATHDSGAGERVWVSYDTRRENSWDVRYAYTANAGALWVLDRRLAEGNGNQFFSNLECAGRGSRRVRAVFLSDADTTYRVQYCSSEGANPSSWSYPLTISDSVATIAMAPVVTDFGVSNDTLNQGLVFYSRPGPLGLWYDAAHFVGVAESGRHPPPRLHAPAAAFARGELTMELCLATAGQVELNLFSCAGKLTLHRDLGYHRPGGFALRTPVAGLASGTYVLMVCAGSLTALTRVVCVR